jgi:phage terminase large subunit
MPTPSPTEAEPWPPDYTAEFAARQVRLLKLRSEPNMIVGAKEFYRTRPVEFIEHWCCTYDPRKAGTDTPSTMPFRLFRRQRDLIHYLRACLSDQESGLIEKCRDMGATWVCCAFSVWLWMFWPGASVGWGSRKEQLVDKLGDPDSIFEKMRKIIGGLPREFLPEGLNRDVHMTYMKFINPENEATITGEAGDNIGRGGRKLIYFKDESAHYERPERIEAALGDNTNVQIDISSVNGQGNVFHRRRKSGVEWVKGAEIPKGKTRVFVMDWRHHPAKTQEWYDRRRQKAEDDGLLHLFAQEVDRDYAASVEGVIIPLAWVNSAIDAHLRLGFDDSGLWGAGLDVADGGLDKNALALRKGSVLKSAQDWAARDTGETARKAVGICTSRVPLEVQYDCIGVGAGVKSEVNRLADEKLLPAGVRFVPWNAGDSVIEPKGRVIPDDEDSPLNEDFYQNLKAQAWWELRGRFHRTHRAVTESITFDPGSLISLPSDLAQLEAIKQELSQPTAGQSARLKLLVNKTPEGTKSPNLADAIVMAFWPMPPPKAFTWHVGGQAITA